MTGLLAFAGLVAYAGWALSCRGRARSGELGASVGVSRVRQIWGLERVEDEAAFEAQWKAGTVVMYADVYPDGVRGRPHFQGDGAGTVSFNVPAFITQPDGTWVTTVQAQISPRGKVRVWPPEARPIRAALDVARSYLKQHKAGLRAQRKLGAHRKGGLYLRFGKWGNVSRCFLNHGECAEDEDPRDRWRDYEAGVSVYHTVPRTQGGYDLVSPDQDQALYSLGGDYLHHAAKLGTRSCDKGEGFLVVGKRVMAGEDYVYGADGEPLLEGSSIRVLAKLAADDIYLEGGRTIRQVAGPLRDVDEYEDEGEDDE